MRRFSDVSWVTALGWTVAMLMLAACGSKASCPKGTVDQGGRCVEANGDASTEEDADTGGDGGGACVGAACPPVCVTETCNGKDDDCDTFVDEGVQTFGPTQLLGDENEYPGGLASWGDKVIQVFKNSNPPVKNYYRVLSADGVPMGAATSLGETEKQLLKIGVVGDVLVVVEYDFIDNDRVRIETYDLANKTSLSGVWLYGEYLGASIGTESGINKVRVAVKDGDSNPSVTAYGVPNLQVLGSKAFSTNPGTTTLSVHGGGGDSSIYTAIANVFLGFAADGTLSSYEVPDLESLLLPNFTVSPDGKRIGVLSVTSGVGSSESRFDVFTRSLELLDTHVVSPMQATPLGAFNANVSSADGTWYASYQTNVGPSGRAPVYTTWLKRLRFSNDTIDEVFSAEVPCTHEMCPEGSRGVNEFPLLISQNGAAVVFTGRFVTPFGCY